MTEDQERRLRSLAANLEDLDARIKALDAAYKAETDHQARAQIRGDLAVAQFARAEADAEMSQIRNSPYPPPPSHPPFRFL